MRKRVGLKVIVPILAIVLFVSAIIVISYKINPTLPQTDEPLLQPVPPPPCTTPNVIPQTITSSITLCGTIMIGTPVVIVNSNVIVQCAPGTTISNILDIDGFDGIQISAGLRNVQIIGCNLNGKFSNAIHLMNGVKGAVKSSQIINNVVTRSLIGIKEEFGGDSNTFSGNSMSQNEIAMQLEGRTGKVIGSTINQNIKGIVLGTDPALLSIGKPNVVCSQMISWANINSTNPMWWGVNVIPGKCSIPQSGSNYIIRQNDISNNFEEGITTYGLDNTIHYNNIQSNSRGIVVNPIYVGSEINPYWPLPSPNNPLSNLQQYFSSGAKIVQNHLEYNREVGIQLTGKSEYYYMTSPQYRKSTVINANWLNNIGLANLQVGTGISVDVGIGNEYSPTWNEVTDIVGNSIMYNIQDGIHLQTLSLMTDIRFNEIAGNLRNGITVGSNFPNYGRAGSRFIFYNAITNNLGEGIHVLYGDLGFTLMNRINSNNRGIYIPESPSEIPQFARDTTCNDLSYNSLEGFNYDSKRINSQFGLFYLNNLMWGLNYNRVFSNGADGVKYTLLNPSNTGIDWSSLFSSIPSRTFNNHIEQNAGFGINVNGFVNMGFFRNNFVNNALGSGRDTGVNRMENTWDELQYSMAFDNVVCKNCGGPCVTDYDCGWYSGTCVNNICQAPPGSGLSCNPVTGNVDCYANPGLMPGVFGSTLAGPYMPLSPGLTGNYGLPGIIPPSAAPPLAPLSCTSNSQCATHSCEIGLPYPSGNYQCGNRDTIGAVAPFGGSFNPVLWDLFNPTNPCPQIPVQYYPPSWGSFPPSQPQEGAGQVLEGEPTISPEVEAMYSSLPEEIRNSPQFREMMKERTAYFERERKDRIDGKDMSFIKKDFLIYNEKSEIPLS